MGMEMQQRIYNYRPTWNLSVNQPVAGNYYPINSAIYIEDSTTTERLTVTNDRAQGGASILNGEIEIMVHRRLLYDDARGVGEPLNETNPWNTEGLVQYMTHIFQFSKPGIIESRQREIQFATDQPTQFWIGIPTSQSPFYEYPSY